MDFSGPVPWCHLRFTVVQTGWPGQVMTAENWRVQLRIRLHELDWEKVMSDVRPFLPDEGQLQALRLRTFERLLSL